MVFSNDFNDGHCKSLRFLTVFYFNLNGGAGESLSGEKGNDWGESKAGIVLINFQESLRFAEQYCLLIDTECTRR